MLVTAEGVVVSECLSVFDLCRDFILASLIMYFSVLDVPFPLLCCNAWALSLGGTIMLLFNT